MSVRMWLVSEHSNDSETSWKVFDNFPKEIGIDHISTLDLKQSLSEAKLRQICEYKYPTHIYYAHLFFDVVDFFL